MNHIKSINEYNDNNYYQKIESYEFFKMISDGYFHKREPFTEDEFDILSKKMRIGFPSYSEWKFYSGGDANIYGPAIDIFKFEDEWYYVDITRKSYTKPISIHREFYKCDQFDGLIELINNIKDNESYKIH